MLKIFYLYRIKFINYFRNKKNFFKDKGVIKGSNSLVTLLMWALGVFKDSYCIGNRASNFGGAPTIGQKRFDDVIGMSLATHCP